jgi:hypothetical protein
MRGIYKKLQTTMVEQGWFGHDKKSYQLHELMEESLRHSHLTRIERNAEVDLTMLDGLDDPRLEYARAGTATPEELFTLLADRPELGSLELAKLSHPFDFEAPLEMDDAMVDLILALSSRNNEADEVSALVGQILDGEPRYKVKRVDHKLPAAVVLRKQDLMDFPVDEWGGKVRIVRRQGFLVFDGEGMEGGGQLEHLLRVSENPKLNAHRNEKTLSVRIGDYLEKHPHGQPYGWVQPQASSYYAKHIPVKPVVI